MTGKYKPWGIGCLFYGVILVIAFVAYMNDERLLMWPSMLWVVGAVAGIVLLAQKGYLAMFGALGCISLLLVGWWAIIILLVLGPIVWAVGLFLGARKRCEVCQETIWADATRCPHCTSVIGA